MGNVVCHFDGSMRLLRVVSASHCIDLRSVPDLARLSFSEVQRTQHGLEGRQTRFSYFSSVHNHVNSSFETQNDERQCLRVQQKAKSSAWSSQNKSARAAQAAAPTRAGHAEPRLSEPMTQRASEEPHLVLRKNIPTHMRWLPCSFCDTNIKMLACCR